MIARPIGLQGRLVLFPGGACFPAGGEDVAAQRVILAREHAGVTKGQRLDGVVGAVRGDQHPA